ncbi:MAG: glycosyltransferase family 9 protein [bacterium]
MKKILLIQHRQIGDVLMCTPAVRAIRKKFVEAEITFMVEKFSYRTLSDNPNIDKFIIPSRKMSLSEYIKLLLKLQREKFDIVIDFFHNPKSASITWFSRAEKRISFTTKWRNYAYTIKVDPGDDNQYAALQNLRLLRPLGIENNEGYSLDFFINEEDREWANNLWDKLNLKSDDLILALSPVSRRSYKVWPSECYAQLSDYLIKKYGAKILFTWGPGEKSFINAITSKMKQKPIVDYPMPTIKQLKAIFEKSSFFIGNDNGPRHIAISAGIPTVGLFGKTNPYHWTPPNSQMHTIISNGKRGMRNLSLQSVMKEIDSKFEILSTYDKQ